METRTGVRERLLTGLPMSERRLELAGIPTSVLEGGEGSPIVLLHGPGEYGAKWLRVIPELVKTHRVIAPDLPGHGASGAGEDVASHERVLDWLGALIDRTCGEPPVLVGQIIGGAIAARFACERGGRLSALVLCDALGLAPFQPTPEFGQALAEFIGEPSGATHDRLWSRCAFDLDRLRTGLGERWDWIKAYNLDCARLPELRAVQQALMQQFGLPAIAPDMLAGIAVPTALIWGRHDLATPLAVAEQASRRLGWPLDVIENAADDPPMEQPQAFVATLRDALERARLRAAWDCIAPGYDRTNTATQIRLGAQALRRAGLGAGMRFLDVAAGSGALSIPAARLGAQVVAIDQSAAMLEHLRARAAKEGLDIETRVMDGHRLALDDGSFDIAGSQFGVMLFADMPRALREMARVVRAGGRAMVAAYGDPQRIDFLRFLVGALQRVRPSFDGPPMDPPPLEFQLADPQRLLSELRAAGLRDVTVETVTETTDFASGSELWDWLVSSNPIVEEMLRCLELTQAERATVVTALEATVRERAGAGATAALHNPVHIGVGSK